MQAKAKTIISALCLCAAQSALAADGFYQQLVGTTGIDAVVNTAFAVFCGCGETFYRGVSEETTVKNIGIVIIGRMVLSIIIGLMVFFFTEGMKLDDSIQFAIVGLSAFMGRIIPDAAASRLIRIISGRDKSTEE